MIPSAAIRKFLADGTKPSTERERTALLDECRALFGEVATGKRNITTGSAGAMNCLSSPTRTAPTQTAKRPAPTVASNLAAKPIAAAPAKKGATYQKTILARKNPIRASIFAKNHKL